MKKLWVKLFISFIVLMPIGFLSGQTIQQNSHSSGLGIHFQTGINHLRSDDLGIDFYSSALAFRGGLRYGFNEFFSLGIQYIQSLNIWDYPEEEYKNNIFQLEGRLTFLGTQSRFRPSVAFCIARSSGNPVLIIENIEGIGILKGFGMGTEAGLSYYLNNNTHILLSLSYIFGNYTNNQHVGQPLDIDYNYSNLFYGIGVGYFLN